MLNIIYEDNAIIVVAKPCNVPVAADKSLDSDLLNQVKAYIKEKYNKPGEVYIGLVHRLDRPAGGCVVFARNSKSASRLSEQVRSHEMERTYYAVVRSRPERLEGDAINYLLKNTQTNTVTIVPSATEGAKKAVLHYKTLQTIEDPKDGVLSLLEVTLQTGRAHQIRVQMAGLGCPLWGDQRYGYGINKKGQQLALWAVRLSLTHPVARDKRVFICYPQTDQPWKRFSLNIESKG